MGFFDDQLEAEISANTLTSEDYLGLSKAGIQNDKAYNLLDRLEQQRQTLASLGADPAEAEPTRSMFWEAVDYLGKPQQYMYGIADSFLRGTGEDIISAAARGDREDLGASEIMRRMGYAVGEDADPLTRWAVNASRGTLGFVLDVATDPLSVVPGLVFGKKVAAGVVGSHKVSKVGAGIADDIARLSSKSVDTASLTDTLFENLHQLYTKPNYADDILLRMEESLDAFAPGSQDALTDLVHSAVAQVDDIFTLERKRELRIDMPFIGWFDKEAWKSTTSGIKTIANNWNDFNTGQKVGYFSLATMGVMERAFGFGSYDIKLPAAIAGRAAAEAGVKATIATNAGLSAIDQNFTGWIGDMVGKGADIAWEKIGGKESLQAFDKTKDIADIKKIILDMIDPELDAGLYNMVESGPEVLTRAPEAQYSLWEKAAMAAAGSDADKLAKAQSALESLKERVDLVAAGNLYDNIRLGVKYTADAKDWVVKNIGGAFSSKIKYGGYVSDQMSKFSTENAAAVVQADYLLKTTLGEDFIKLNPEVKRQTGVRLYSAVQDAVGVVKDLNKEFVDALDKVLKKDAAPGGDAWNLLVTNLNLPPNAKKGQVISESFRVLNESIYDVLTNQQDILKNPLSVEDLNVLGRSQELAEALRKQEIAAGIETPNTLGPYLPTLFYEHALKKGSDFSEFRKHENFADLLLRPIGEELTPVFDFDTVLRARAERSFRRIAEKRFVNRMSLTSSLKKETLIKLQKAAAINPTGPEAQLLKQNGQQVHALFRNIGKGVGEGVIDNYVLSKTGLRKAVAFVDEAVESGNPAVANLAAKQGMSAIATVQEAAYKTTQDIEALSDDGLFFGWKPLETFGEAAVVLEDEVDRLYVPPIIKQAHDEARQSKQYWEAKLGGKGFGKFLKKYDAFNAFNKKMVINMFPASHLTNIISDAGLVFMEHGLSVASAANSLELVAALKGADKIKLPNGTSLDKQMLESLFRRFNFDTSPRIEAEVFDLINESTLSVLDPDKAAGWAQKLTQKFIGKDRGRKLWKDVTGKWDALLEPGYEKFIRRQNFVGYLKKGFSAEDAAMYANRDLIDYRDLTPFERSIAKRLFFFYGFLKGSTKRTLTDMFLRPSMINKQMAQSRALASVMSAEASDFDAPDDYMAKYLRAVDVGEGTSYITGYSKDGTPRISKVNVSLVSAVADVARVNAPRSLRFQDIAEAAMSNTYGTAKGGISKSTPAIQTAFEILSGRNAYFDVPTSEKFVRKIPDLEKVATILADYSPNYIPKEIIKDIGQKFGKSINKALGAVPVDKDGRYVAINPAAYAFLTKMIPFIGRDIGLANKLMNPEIGWTGAIKSGMVPVSPNTIDPFQRHFGQQLSAIDEKIAGLTGGSSVRVTKGLLEDQEMRRNM